MELYIGVEIGATKQQIAVGDKDGNLKSTLSEHVDTSRGAVGILEWLDVNIPEVRDSVTAEGGSTAGIGVGFGGVVDSRSGGIVLSVQVQGWDDLPLKKRFEECYGLPTVVENDTVAGGYGEYRAGVGKGTDSFFYTNIGSGIGGALFIDGRPITGQNRGAVYFGHTRVPSLYEAGKSEKVENICSGFAIERRLRKPGYIPEDSLIHKMGGPDCRSLGKAAYAGDTFALKEIDCVARSFGTGLSNIVTLFHPERLAIGGGVANIGPLLIELIAKYVGEEVFEPLNRDFEVLQCKFKDNAVLVGAVMLAAKTSIE